MTNKQKFYLVFKRVSDFVLAVLLLIILSPIILIAAIWVKLESKGPIIFKQKRPGKHKKIFTIYKFRSMRVEIEKDGRALSDEERMTTSGKVLRKTSIDELPQLWNILKGEMSFIGPRPFLINDLGLYTEVQMIRFEVLPGISSWTAIHGRANLTYEEKFNYEIYYVKNITLKIDLKIFFKTIWLVLSCKDVDDTVKKNKPRIGAKTIEVETNSEVAVGITGDDKLLATRREV